MRWILHTFGKTHVAEISNGELRHPSDLSRSADHAHGASHPDRTRTLRCRTVATSRFRQRHHIRDLQPLGAEASAADQGSILSDDEEPHPSEMLLAALGACLAVSVQANAVARGIPIRKLEIHSRGDVDPSALWGSGDRRVTPLGFQSIAIEVHIDGEAPRAALQSLIDHALLWSPVANTLHDPVHIDVTLVDL